MEEIEKKEKSKGDKFDGESVVVIGQYTSGQIRRDRVIEAKRYSGNYYVIAGIRDAAAQTPKAAVKMTWEEAENYGRALIAMAQKAKVNAE